MTQLLETPMVHMRDVTQQRGSAVAVNEGMTVAELLERGVQGMQLPTVSQAGLPMEYTLRSGSGLLLRPSQTLGEGDTLRELTSGECTAVPRLTAAGIG